MNFQSIIKRAGDALLANEIGQQEHVRNLWQNIEWQPFDKQARDIEAELDQSQRPRIRLYPPLPAVVSES